jgi:hypothetical protein
MVKDAVITGATTSRLAFLFESSRVKALLPPGRPGIYLLYRNGQPIYIGRSDHCVRRRLLSHPLAGVATHVVWEFCRTPVHAFHLESFCFHRLLGQPGMLNRAHPGRPPGTRSQCLTCQDGLLDALSYALGRSIHPVALTHHR